MMTQNVPFAPPAGHALAVATIARLPRAVREAALRAYSLYLAHRRDAYLVPTHDGFSLPCSARDFIQRRILLFGCWEPDPCAVLRALTDPGRTVVDVGANIGYITLLLAGRVGPEGDVIAFEASPGTCERLRRNVERNAADNVTIHNVAVSDERGELTVYQLPEPGSFGSNSGAATTVRDRGGVAEASVESAPLHALLEVRHRETVTLVKIDVEGAELTIVGDLAAHLDDYPSLESIVVEMSDPARAGWRPVVDTLRRAGFSMFAIANDYAYARYMDWTGPTPLVPLEGLPRGHTDVLFTRRDLGDTSLEVERERVR